MMIKLIILIFQTKICPGMQIMNPPDKKIKGQSEKLKLDISLVRSEYTLFTNISLDFNEMSTISVGMYNLSN